MKYLYICLFVSLIGCSGCSLVGLSHGDSEAIELHVFILDHCSGIATIDDSYLWNTALGQRELNKLLSRFVANELEQGSVPFKKRLVGAEWTYGEYVSFCDRDGQLVVLAWGE